MVYIIINMKDIDTMDVLNEENSYLYGIQYALQKSIVNDLFSIGHKETHDLLIGLHINIFVRSRSNPNHNQIFWWNHFYHLWTQQHKRRRLEQKDA